MKYPYRKYTDSEIKELDRLGREREMAERDEAYEDMIREIDDEKGKC